MVGKIYFAYVDPGDPFNPATHDVEDEDVFDLKINQSEGSFAQAEVTIKNSGIGLLNPSRKKRVFISVDDGGTAKLLFAGRLVGFPLDFGSELVTINAIAQPEGWQATQFAFTEALKVHPYYNPLFVPEESREIDAEILSGYSALLHWHRADGTLSLSDVLEGSDLIDLGTDTFFDSLSSSVGDPPIKGLQLSVEVQWNQIGAGLADCSESIRSKFINTAIATSEINSLTPLALEKGWEGVRVPTGYTISESKLVPVANSFGLVNANLRSQVVTVLGTDYPTSNGSTPPTRDLTVPRVWYQGKLVLQANYEQKRREVFATTLLMATQELSLTSDQYEEMAFRLQDPTSVVNGEVLDVSSPSFFMDGLIQSTHGQQVIEHALMRGRARLIKSSRIIETSFECAIDDVIDITCDHSVRIEDDRLPGGSIRGKVLGYEFHISATDQVASITIGSCIGTGADSSGTGLAVGTTVYDNEVGTATMTSEIFYEQDTPPSILVPIDVAQMEADDEYLVIDTVVENDGESQNAGIVGQPMPDVYLQNNRTRVEVELRSMNPEPELYADIPITTYTLTLPRQIDLEA